MAPGICKQSAVASSKQTGFGRVKLLLLFLTALACLDDVPTHIWQLETGEYVSTPSPPHLNVGQDKIIINNLPAAVGPSNQPPPRAGAPSDNRNRQPCAAASSPRLINDPFKRLDRSAPNDEPQTNRVAELTSGCCSTLESGSTLSRESGAEIGGRGVARPRTVWTSLSVALRRLLPVVRTAYAIRIVRLEAPKTANVGQTIKFRCIYDTRNDKLLSLSWSKNRREFYRYQPSERRQPVLAFNTPGVQLDMSRSRNSTITLVNATVETSGQYQCEVTGASFQEAKMETSLEVHQTVASSTSERTPGIGFEVVATLNIILLIFIQ